MPFMARRLIRADPLLKADVIVVLGSNRSERTLEAGMLYREGWAPRILLLRPPDVMRDSLRQQLGLNVPVYVEIQQDLLRQMKIPQSAIVLSARRPDSTRNEAAAVGADARQYGWQHVIVVTSPYHTGRAGALFDRALPGSCRAIMRPDRFETVDPNEWWLSYPDRYDVVNEYLSRIYALSFRR